MSILASSPDFNMTTPHQNQLPEEVKPPYKISEREPVWPCWLYSTHHDFWSKHDYWEPLAGPEEHGWTHWHPDQPTAPTDTPYLAP